MSKKSTVIKEKEKNISEVISEDTSENSNSYEFSIDSLLEAVEEKGVGFGGTRESTNAEIIQVLSEDEAKALASKIKMCVMPSSSGAEKKRFAIVKIDGKAVFVYLHNTTTIYKITVNSYSDYFDFGNGIQMQAGSVLYRVWKTPRTFRDKNGIKSLLLSLANLPINISSKLNEKANS